MQYTYNLFFVLEKRPGEHMHKALEKLLIIGVKNRYIKERFLRFHI